MVTTSAQLQNNEGGAVCWALVIEGFDNIISNHSPLSAVTTAWSGSGWTTAIPGLSVEGQFSQGLEPFKNQLDVSTVRFVVQPDESDTLGTAVWKTLPSAVSPLNAVFGGADGEDITVLDTGDFASSGAVYIGNQRHAYTATTATTFTIAAGASGQRSPFKADTLAAGQFPKPYRMPDRRDNRYSLPPRVSDVPRTWIGKHVGLWLHTITDDSGTLNSKADALVVFAGVITDIQDTPNGTILECEDMRGKIGRTQLLRDQWVGTVTRGIRLQDGDKFYASEQLTGASSDADPFVVVDSGASGANQANDGYYEVEALFALLNDWLDDEVNTDANLTADWDISLVSQEGGVRSVVSAVFSVVKQGKIKFGANNPFLLQFLGFTNIKLSDNIYWATSDFGYGTEFRASGEKAPYRVKPMQRATSLGFAIGNRGTAVTVSDSRGEWFDNASWLPHPLNTYTDGSSEYGIVIMDGSVGLAKVVTSDGDGNPATIELTAPPGIGELIVGKEFNAEAGITFDDPDGDFEIRQAVIVVGDFTDIWARVFATVNGDGVNHATYDSWPSQLGCAVPWELLGDSFVDSLQSIEQGADGKGAALFLDKPTRVIDCLIPEMTLRFAWLIWKDEGYQFVTLQTPNSSTADHTLDETNKAGRPGESLRATARTTDSYLVNEIKVEYNRDVEGKYRSKLNIVHEESVDTYGSKGVTIKARNSFGALAQTGTAVENLAAGLASRMAPTFAKPLRVVRRSIALNLFHAAPGDTVSLSDDDVRDPTTGTRGLTSRPCTIIKQTHNYGIEGGSLFGEVELLFSEEERTFPLSPAAEIDETLDTPATSSQGGTWDKGYDSTNKIIGLKANAYSRGSDADDITHFDAGDKIRVIEMDASNPASPTTWTDTIVSVDEANQEITLTTGLAGWDNTLTYRVISDAYTTAQASQITDAYQADDADSYILDTIEPNLYGENQLLNFATTTGQVLPKRYNQTEYGDGKPFHPGIQRDLAIMVNNLVQYKCNASAPFMFDTTSGSGGAQRMYVGSMATDDWNVQLIFPLFIGGFPPSGSVRKVYANPIAKLNSPSAGHTGTIRLSSSRFPPKGTGSDLMLGGGTGTPIFWEGPVNHTTWSLDNSDSTYAALGQSSVKAVPAQAPFATWITVSLQWSNVPVYLHGFTELRLGAHE